MLLQPFGSFFNIQFFVWKLTFPFALCIGLSSVFTCKLFCSRIAFHCRRMIYLYIGLPSVFTSKHFPFFPESLCGLANDLPFHRFDSPFLSVIIVYHSSNGLSTVFLNFFLFFCKFQHMDTKNIIGYIFRVHIRICFHISAWKKADKPRPQKERGLSRRKAYPRLKRFRACGRRAFFAALLRLYYDKPSCNPAGVIR